ncbi:MAG: hydroxymyristoyl-ACP dehydratase [Lentimicrobiaceae bacterium]|nr:hydroxymyristoyl-ACP dehydratase [Lentimicrobiaceae bacterium]
MASSQNIICSGNDLLRLIPQRPPMVMIDKLRSCENKVTITALTPQADNLFAENGLFTEPGLIENIAQTAAAGVGYRVSRDATEGKTEIPLGFIGAVKNLKIYFLPKLGDEIITTVTIEHEVLDATIINGTIRCGGQLVAECEMKIFLKK